MKKIIISLILLSAVVFSFAETLVIKGSNTVFPIAQRWVEELKKERPDLDISLEGQGSSTGIAALFNNTADIANSSRWLKSSEIEKMNKEGQFFAPIIVAYDGIALIVNKSLKIDELSIDTLKKIYTGEIKTWNQIDPNLPKNQIVKYTRNTASGTYETFEGFVLGGAKMDPRARFVESTQVELDSVSKNPNAIAYIGVGYVDDSVKVIKVNGILPTKSNILTNTYPISRPLYMFINVKNGYPMSGKIKEYINFGLSKRGQEIVEEVGYVAAYGY